MLKNLFNVFTGTASGADGVRMVAAGPLSKQPASTIYRLVLIETETQFIVYTEQFGDKLMLMDDGFYKSNFANGYYYYKPQLVEATKKFGSRLIETAANLESLYHRGEPSA